MASNARVFFAGVGTTFVILAIGFGGGLMLAKTAMEPSASSHSIADQLPPVRVILPASAEAAMPPPQPPVEPAAAPEPSPPVMAAKEAQQAFEKEKQIERAERRKAEAEERARRKKYAERKARREAARLVNRQQEQQPGILAFGVDGDQSRGGAGSFFGN
jgi:type IV secretory pathway VirB10-like protein